MRTTNRKYIIYILIILVIILFLIGTGLFLYFMNIFTQKTIEPTKIETTESTNLEITQQLPEPETETRNIPENTPTIQSTKKNGICMSPKITKCEDFKLFKSAAWYYNWGMKTKINCSTNMEFVPMIFGYKSTHEYTKDMIEPGTKYIMSSNEPNHIDQANVTPEQEIEKWIKMQKVFGETHKLISASSSGCGKPEKCIAGYQTMIGWFDEFFRLADEHYKKTGVELRVDYIAIHLYKNSLTAAKTFIESLRKYGKKIWITEMGSFSKNQDTHLRFMKEVIPYLEQEDLIYRYAWYVNRTQSGVEVPHALIDENDNLTPIGEQYKLIIEQYNPTENIEGFTTFSKKNLSETERSWPHKYYDNSIGHSLKAIVCDRKWIN